MIPRTVVIDAACVIDLLVGSRRALPVLEAVIGRRLAAPVHIDQEVVSALAWIQRAGAARTDIDERLEVFRAMPLSRHSLVPLLRGAWMRAESLPISDGLYVELAEQLKAPLVTGNPDMAAASSSAILVEAILVD